MLERASQGPELAAFVAQCAAFWVALLLYARRRGSEGSVRHAVGLGLGAVLAHLGWAALHLDAVRDRPLAAIAPWSGFTVFLVPAGPLLASLPRSSGAERRAFLAAALGTLPPALALARLGCAFAGCCHGLPTELPWGRALEADGAARHPVPLYEIAAHGLLFAGLRPLPARAVPGVFLGAFGALRLGLEPLRAPPPLGPPLVPVEALAGLWSALGVAALGREALRRIPAAPRLAAPDREPARAALLVAAVWTVLAAGALSAPPLGRGAALLLAFTAATALAVAHRPPARGPRLRATALFGAGLLAGYASLPAWVTAIALVGRALGLAPRDALPPGHGAASLWVATVVLAPLFEEIVYRGRLLPALARPLGLGPALLVASAAFALPHLGPWLLLGTFLVGLHLGAAMQLYGSLALCIGLHMGLNAGAVLCGLPPARLALPPTLALLVPVGLLSLPFASSCARGRAGLRPSARRTRHHAGAPSERTLADDIEH